MLSNNLFIGLLCLACSPRLERFEATSIGTAAVADLDHDGALDLIVSSTITPQIDLFFNGGKGKFLTNSILPLDVVSPGGAKSLAVGDLDGDGATDLVAVLETRGVTQPESNKVQLFRNQGDGSFAAPTLLQDTLSPLVVVVSDFNGDNSLDLAISQQEGPTGAPSSSVALFFNNGAGEFQLSSSFDLLEERQPESLQKGDLDADGDEDLFVGRPSSLFLNNGLGQFQFRDPGFVLPQESGFPGPTLGDFNADGLLDILVSSPGNDDNSTWQVAQNQGDATFVLLPSIEAQFHSQSVAAGDFNGDGALDFGLVLHKPLLIDDTGSVKLELTLFLNEEQGKTWRERQVDSLHFQATHLIAVADFEDDGADDLVLSNLASRSEELALLLFR
jgi:hypothetical protein